MARKILVTFSGNRTMLRAVGMLFDAAKVPYAITIYKTTGQGLTREIHYPERVRVRRVTRWKSTIR